MTITIKTTPEGADTLTDALATYAEHFPEFAPTAEALLRELRACRKCGEPLPEGFLSRCPECAE